MKSVIQGALAILAAVSVPLGASCSGEKSSTGSTSSGSGSGGGGGASLQSFRPEGCSFSIAPRPEYQGFALGSPKTAALPLGVLLLEPRG